MISVSAAVPVRVGEYGGGDGGGGDVDATFARINRKILTTQPLIYMYF